MGGTRAATTPLRAVDPSTCEHSKWLYSLSFQSSWSSSHRIVCHRAQHTLFSINSCFPEFDSEKTLCVHVVRSVSVQHSEQLRRRVEPQGKGSDPVNPPSSCHTSLSGQQKYGPDKVTFDDSSRYKRRFHAT